MNASKLSSCDMLKCNNNNVIFKINNLKIRDRFLKNIQFFIVQDVNWSICMLHVFRIKKFTEQIISIIL